MFPFDSNKYEILIHPQSLVHAIVKLKNGTTFFLYHLPDMKIPISNALFDSKFDYFKYFKNKNLDNFSCLNLEFFAVDKEKFSTIELISEMKKSDSAPIAINAINEIFVDEFLKNNIGFNDILAYLKLVLKDKDYIKSLNMPCSSIKNIYKIDTWARNLAYKIIKKNKIK